LNGATSESFFLLNAQRTAFGVFGVALRAIEARIVVGARVPHHLELG